MQTHSCSSDAQETRAKRKVERRDNRAAILGQRVGRRRERLEDRGEESRDIECMHAKTLMAELLVRCYDDA
jgi:hypothetical protein